MHRSVHLRRLHAMYQLLLFPRSTMGPHGLLDAFERRLCDYYRNYFDCVLFSWTPSVSVLIDATLSALGHSFH